jgi:hypothetical protein
MVMQRSVMCLDHVEIRADSISTQNLLQPKGVWAVQHCAFISISYVPVENSGLYSVVELLIA